VRRTIWNCTPNGSSNASTGTSTSVSIPAKLIKREQTKEELAHYAKATVDIEYRFPGSLGFSELEGIANRQDYDLSAHSRDIPRRRLEAAEARSNTHTTAKLDYFDDQWADPATGKKGRALHSLRDSNRRRARPARRWLSCAKPTTKSWSVSRTKKL
jgi:glycyl-tRNA synthetase (class II)